MSARKTPPLLLGAALIFWGWQTDFLLPGILMALVLECSRWTRLRWELADEDFSRIWVFCTLLFLGAALYAFTANEGPADFRGLLQNPNFLTQRNAGAASARTAAAMIRWLPMIFFFFMAAQAFSARQGIPMETISLILRWRWRRAKKAGLPPPARQFVNISYPYFAICLFAATAHSRDDGSFFWGMCALVTWALWSQRSRRFSIAVWAGCLGVAMALGYGGQRGVSQLQRYVESLNAQWLSGFSRRDFDASRGRTALGRIGKIKTSGKIMIRLETKKQAAPPPLLREASYRTYKAETWYSGNAKNEPEPITASQTNKETWILLPAKTNTASVNIACYLEGGRRFGSVHTGLLPLASGSGQLERLPVYVLKKSKGGAVMAQGPGLVMFENLYGPGETIDSPPEEEDSHPPPEREIWAVRKVVAELQVEGKTFEQKLNRVQQFFQTEFSYRMWQDRDRSSPATETPLSRFLLRTRSGHCEYFATATVLLLRQLEIPARYAVGYAVHESSGKQYVVRQRDAHAWCLVWNADRKIWQDFDTTPASWVQAEARSASLWQSLSDAWSRLVFEISKLRWGHSRIRQYLLWSLVPVLVVLLFQIIVRSRRGRDGGDPARLAKPVWPGEDSEFYHFERRLIARGLSRQVGEPLSGWLFRSLTQLEIKQMQDPLQRLLELHYRYRFDPHGLSTPEREQLRLRAKECLTLVQEVAAEVTRRK